MVGREAVVAKEPRAALLLANKVNGHIGAPGSLAVFGGDSLLYEGSGFPPVKVTPALSLLSQPLGVGVLRPIGLRMMGPVKHFVSIINPFFHHPIGTGGQMQLTRQTAGISRIGKKAADQFLGSGNRLPVLATTCGARITPREKGCTTGRANRALAIGVRECHPIGYQRINIRRIDQGIPKSANGVPALLIGADPENIGLIRHGC